MSPARAVSVDAIPALARVVGRHVVIMTADGRLSAVLDAASPMQAHATLAELTEALTTVGLEAAGWRVGRR